MKTLKCLIVLLSLLIASDAVAIQLKSEKKPTQKTEQKEKGCTIVDIMGGWHLIYFKEEPPQENTTTFRKQFPFEHLVFAANGKLAYMHENRPPPNLKGELDHLVSSKSKTGFSFTLSDTGRIAILLSGKPFESYWCQVISKTGGGYNEGDIILTSQAKNVTTTKVFRKILAP